MSNLTLGDVQTQSGGLHSLLYMLYEASCDLDYASDKPGATDAANRVNHLIILARDEAERLDTAIGECITNQKAEAHTIRALLDEQKTGQSELEQAHTNAPTFDVRQLTMDGLYSTYDAMTTMHDIANAMCCQPRFNTDKADAPAHGALMGALTEYFAELMDRISREASTRKPANEDDRRRKFFFVTEQYTDGLCDPDYAVTGVKKALAKLWGAK